MGQNGQQKCPGNLYLIAGKKVTLKATAYGTDCYPRKEYEKILKDCVEEELDEVTLVGIISEIGLSVPQLDQSVEVKVDDDGGKHQESELDDFDYEEMQRQELIGMINALK